MVSFVVCIIAVLRNDGYTRGESDSEDSDEEGMDVSDVSLSFLLCYIYSISGVHGGVVRFLDFESLAPHHWVQIPQGTLDSFM